MLYMDETRYPFVITDEMGYVIFSMPHSFDVGGNIFSAENFSALDIKLAKNALSLSQYDQPVLLRNKTDGKAVIISAAMYPSVRVLVAVYTDIDYGIAADYCCLHCADAKVRPRDAVKETIKHERIYPKVSRLLFDIKSMFRCDVNYADNENACIGMKNRIEIIAKLCFCSYDLIFENVISDNALARFDGGIFSYYMLLMLSAASDISPQRKAEIYVSGTSDDDIVIKIRMNRFESQENIIDFEKLYRSAVRKLDDSCSRLNIPSYFIVDDGFESGITPSRLDFSLMGLKEPYYGLKYEEQEQNQHRNIFVSFSVPIKQG